jgi:hypothetical protein
MSPNDTSTSPAHEPQRLERICAALLAAFEAHPETRDTDLCAFKLDNQRGVVIDDYDDPGELWTARRVAAQYAVGVQFIYARADELGAIRLGAGPRPRPRVRPGGRARAVGERERAAARRAPAAPPSGNEAACCADCRASGVRER